MLELPWEGNTDSLNSPATEDSLKMSNSLHIFLDQKRRLEDALASLKFLMLMCSLSQLSWVLDHHKTMGRFHFSPSDLTAVLNPHADSGSGGF